jgi:Domain of unknown function (DUF4388)
LNQVKGQEGSLATQDVADLIQQLHKQRWTGSLILSHAGFMRKIAVSAGQLVFANSSNPDDRMGERLLRQGRVSLRQYTEASRAVVPGKRLGTLLVENGVLTPKDLVRAVIEHSTEIVYGAFQWTEGRYRLQAGFDSSEAITLKMSTPDLILEGLRRVESWSRVLSGIGAPEAQYARNEEYESIIGKTTLSFEKLAVLTGLHGTRDVASICEDSTLSDFEVCRTLWAFRVIGAITRVDVAAPAGASFDDEGLGAVLGQD